MQVQAAATGARWRRGRRTATSLAEINVTPLVDVMLVLLIIFMVTAPMMQRGVDVNVPVARRPQKIQEERLIVSVPKNFPEDHVVWLGDKPVKVEILDERVRQELVSRSDKSVFLRGDAALTLQHLMTVLDRLKDGGVEKVAIVSERPEEKLR